MIFSIAMMVLAGKSSDIMAKMGIAESIARTNSRRPPLSRSEALHPGSLFATLSTRYCSWAAVGFLRVRGSPRYLKGKGCTGHWSSWSTTAKSASLQRMRFAEHFSMLTRKPEAEPKSSIIPVKTLKSSTEGRRKVTTSSAYIEVRIRIPAGASGVSNPAPAAFSIIRCRISMIRMKSCGDKGSP
jgi:hypothetical protein